MKRGWSSLPQRRAAFLKRIAKKTRPLRENVEEYTLNSGRRIYLLAQGRLVNLSAAEGHPAMVMDMSFANQSLSVVHIIKHGRKLEKAVYPVPPAIDAEIARMKLATMGIKIDRLTADQKKYLAAWQEGT